MDPILFSLGALTATCHAIACLRSLRHRKLSKDRGRVPFPVISPPGSVLGLVHSQCVYHTEEKTHVNTMWVKLAVDTHVPSGTLLIALPGLAHAVPTMAPDEVLLLLSSDDGETETQDLRHLDNSAQLTN